MDDAQFLLGGGRTNAAVYLGGYAVECILKILILTTTPTNRHAEILKSFRGMKAHDLDCLWRGYRQSGGSGIPPDIARAFRRMNTWQPHMRYEPGLLPLRDSQAFLKAAAEFVRWADERI